MQARSLRFAGLNPASDMREFLNRNRAPGAFSLGNKHLRYAVVGVFAEAGLLTRKFLQSPLGGFGVATLQTSFAPSELAADALDARSGVTVAIAVKREIDHAEINAEHAFNADFLRVRRIADARQIPLAAHEHQIDLTLAEGEQRTLARAADERDFQPTGKRPNTDGIGGGETDNPVIIGLCGEAPKVALAIFAGFVCVRRFGDATHRGLRGQAEHLADLGIGQPVQVELPKLSCLEAACRQVIAGCIAALQRLAQRARLFLSWFELNVRYQFHISNMEIFAESFNRKAALPPRHSWRGLSVENRMSDWPKHENGENKAVGEMTEEERHRVMDAAKDRLLARKDVSEVTKLMALGIIQKVKEDNSGIA